MSGSQSGGRRFDPGAVHQFRILLGYKRLPGPDPKRDQRSVEGPRACHPARCVAAELAVV